eukprot:TRINITY_DN4135_c0_g1_i1.p1 TRINITY_DN4135_c0_g1~~TRINITY_DN4135_c0_g1_i1.p1  ORF type:complete len:322 (-),score=54.54 TRINITY_DN4135_c0_g1_i1:172-1137(-)
MTHFNPYSFPAHFVLDIVAVIWLYVFSRFFGYSYWNNLRHKRNLKFWCYTLLWSNVLFWLFYDFCAILFGYYFTPLGPPGAMMLLSEQAAHKFQYLPTAFLDVALVSHTALLFLLISFWHTLFKNDTVAVKFVKKWEFKAFFVYAIISILAYPLTQWPFVNHKNPLLIIVIPQFIYVFELTFSSVLFLIVVFRMRRELQTGELIKIAPMIGLLIQLIYLLIFFDMAMALSFLFINAIYLGYDGYAPAAEHAVTLGVWDFMQCVFIMMFLCVVMTICFILNVGQLTRLIEGRGLKSTTTAGGTQPNTMSSQSKSQDNSPHSV